MHIGGALRGIELKPEHKSYIDIEAAFSSDDRRKAYHQEFLKYEEVEAGSLDLSNVLLSIFEIRIALNLSEDGFLVQSVQSKLSCITTNLIDEAFEKKFNIDSFFIRAPKRGRKPDHYLHHKIISMVYDNLNTNNTMQEVYEYVATQLYKSPDHVRRIFERHKKTMMIIIKN